MKFIKDFFTEADNETWDLGRVMWTAGFLLFCCLAIWNANKFDPQAFGIGISGIIASGGVMIWSKDKEKDNVRKP